MPKHRRTRRPPKRSLALPDLEQTKSAVLNSLTSKSGQRTYDHAINEFVDWYCSEPRLAFNRTVVLRYRIYLEQRLLALTTINLRLAAVRRVASEAADSGLLSPELAVGIRRVKGVRRIGIRIGNWLTADQVLCTISQKPPAEVEIVSYTLTYASAASDSRLRRYYRCSPRFLIKLDFSTGSTPRDGRLILIVSKDMKGEPRSQVTCGVKTQQI